MWSNAHAEISTNGGSSWTGDNDSDPGLQSPAGFTDFGFAFTLDGGPRSIQSVGTLRSVQLDQ